MNRLHVPPIERDTLSYVGIRVAVRMIALDYKKRPEAYTDLPAMGILRLAERSRLLWPWMYSPLTFVAKAVSQGSTLAEVRCMDIAYAPRALHKRRPS